MPSAIDTDEPTKVAFEFIKDAKGDPAFIVVFP